MSPFLILAFCDPECHMNAQCTVTEGIASCDCISGYTGDGVTCNGRHTYTQSMMHMLILPIQ